MNQVVSKRMVKQQQMRWTQQGAHLLLQIRTQALNGDLRGTFCRWYPGMKPDSRNQNEYAASIIAPVLSWSLYCLKPTKTKLIFSSRQNCDPPLFAWSHFRLRVIHWEIAGKRLLMCRTLKTRLPCQWPTSK